MSIVKSFGKFKQWTNEKLGYARGTEVSEQFKEFEKHVDTRRDASDLVMSVSRKYVSTLEPKKFIHITNPEIPLNALGNSLQDFSTLLGSDSQLGSLLTTIGTLQTHLANHQSDFSNSLKQGFVAEWEHYVSEGEKYVELRRKLESRRLDYDAKLTKVQRAKKEKPELEEEVRASLFKYEETLNEVQNKMSYLLDFEEDGMNALQLLLSAQIAYYGKCASALQKVQSGLSNLPSGKPRTRLTTTLTRSPSSQSPVSTTTPTTTSQRGSQYPSSERPPPPSRSGSYHSAVSIGHARTPSASIELPPPTPKASSASSVTVTRRSSSSFLNTPKFPQSLERASTPVAVSPAGPRILRASFDFKGEADNELSFNVGDCITFVQEVDAGWWIGEIGGKRGIFPSNYVEDESPKPIHRNVSPTVIPQSQGSSATSLPSMPRSQYGSTNSISSTYSSYTTTTSTSSPANVSRGIPAMLVPPISAGAQSSPLKAASSTAPCSTCGCDEFKENLFRPRQCNNCFHNH